MSNKNKKLIVKILITAAIAVVGIAMIAPLVWMISASLKNESEVFNFPIQWIPENPILDNYIKAFSKFPYFSWYFNTAKITFCVVIFTVIFTAFAGYAFAKINFKGKKMIFLLYIACLMIPLEVRLIPQFMLYRNIGLINSHLSVILPWVLFNGFAIFYMRQAFSSIPNELIEAAVIDGCGHFKIFTKICFPLVKAPVISLGILSFTWAWNDYLSPLVYLTNTKNQVLSVGIASFRAQYATNYALQMAGATVALIPIIAVYLIAQRYLIEGVSHTGVKG